MNEWIGNKTYQYNFLPDLKFSSLRLLKILFNSAGNTCFGIPPLILDSNLHSLMTRLATSFKGLNTATSKGWVKWVEFGINGTKATSLSRQLLSTFSLKWHPKLSPIITFRPCKCEMCGMKTFSNQVENVLISNQPFFDTEYTVPMKTMKSKFL